MLRIYEPSQQILAHGRLHHFNLRVFGVQSQLGAVDPRNLASVDRIQQLRIIRARSHR